MIKKILIYGNGDMAELAYQYFKEDSEYQVIAFIADKQYIINNIFCDLPVYSFEEIELNYPPSRFKVFVAVGFSAMRNRKVMYDKIKNKGYSCVNYISTKALVDSSLILGENNFILSNVVIDPFVKIGDNNIVWTSSNICHHVTIKSHSFIASQSLIGGFSLIGNNCFLGFNSTIIHRIVLDEETLVGAKSLIIADTKPYTQYVGIPGREIKSHEISGIKVQ